MATQKPISTISYNTELFLREKLETWISSHIIQAYQYIKHKGEDGDKDHIHLRIEPNKRLDPMDLMEQLKEYKIGQDKPLCCRPWRPSKEEDWILYAVHDKTYLKIKYGGDLKGEKIPYTWQDIQVPDYYDMEIAYIRAKAYLENTSVNIASRLQKGEKPIDIVMQGANVYTVNALLRLLSGSDYQRISRDLIETQDKLKTIVNLVNENGLSVLVDENGRYFLE